jgi:hypothetical protein
MEKNVSVSRDSQQQFILPNVFLMVKENQVQKYNQAGNTNSPECHGIKKEKFFMELAYGESGYCDIH